MIDVVTVYHRDDNYRQALDLKARLERTEKVPFRFIEVDNRVHNRGFARGCNHGARQGTAPIIGFLNPDVIVRGAFFHSIVRAMGRPNVVIAGENFRKPQREIRSWGCRTWVCGAAMFVDRAWFTKVGGFDDKYVWGWEETDLIRVAQHENRQVVALRLPIHHASPTNDHPEDVAYKNKHFEAGAKRFKIKWANR